MYTYCCSKCGEDLPRSAYHKDPSGKGHYSICKKCRSNDDRRILNDLMANSKKRAKHKGLEFSITRQDIIDQNEKQNGKCVYTGIDLNWEIGEVDGRQRVCPPERVSLDRIDSKKGYTPDNIQLVTEFMNRIKGWYPESDIYRFCKAVIDNY